MTKSPNRGNSRQLGRVADIRHVGVVTPGDCTEDDPETGLEAALRLSEKGEALGFDSAWVRSRHLDAEYRRAATFAGPAWRPTAEANQVGDGVIQLGDEICSGSPRTSPPSIFCQTGGAWRLA